jgi:hypothetical protein
MRNDVWSHGMSHHEFIAFLSGEHSIADVRGHTYFRLSFLSIKNGIYMSYNKAFVVLNGSLYDCE